MNHLCRDAKNICGINAGTIVLLPAVLRCSKILFGYPIPPPREPLSPTFIRDAINRAHEP
jgi:hypothetical protein